MSTQAILIQNLQAAINEMQLAYNALLVANQTSGNLVTVSTITNIQTDITTAYNAINALVPVFNGNN
jgi:hypothetical protein